MSGWCEFMKQPAPENCSAHECESHTWEQGYWKPLFTAGAYEPSVQLDETAFNELIGSSADADGFVYVRREAEYLEHPWDDIYIKMRTADIWPSAYHSLLVTWPHDDGNWGEPVGFK